MNRRQITWLAVGLSIAAASFVSASALASGSGASSHRTQAQVRQLAEQAAVAWQRVFVIEPMSTTGPLQMQPVSSSVAMTATHAALTSAARLFVGRPLDVLAESLARSASAARPIATPGPTAGAFTVCIDAGATRFHFQSVHVKQREATVVFTAYAWTTNVDHMPGAPNKLDRASGTGIYHLHLVSTDGGWRVDHFDAAPLGE